MLGNGVSQDLLQKCQKQLSTKNIARLASTKEIEWKNSSFKKQDSLKLITSKALQILLAAKGANCPMLTSWAFSKQIKEEVSEKMINENDIKE